MCLAIYQPAGNCIPIEHLSNGYQNNPDGAGFSYFDENGRVRTFRSMSWSEFRVAYEQAWDDHGHDSPFSIHFRWATHGSKNVENVHPFMVNEHVSIIHNGIIPCRIPDNRMSDTAAFAKHYLSKLPVNWYDDEFLFDMVEDYIGASKLVVLTSHPEAKYSAYILNERQGKWDDKIWYSNNGYCSAPDKKFFSFGSKNHLDYEEEENDLGECKLCGVVMVYDGMCYECETCQDCMQVDGACACYKQLSLHDLTDAQYVSYTTPF